MYGKAQLRLVGNLSNKMYFILTPFTSASAETSVESEVVEFWLDTTSSSTKLGGSFGSDYTGRCKSTQLCRWSQEMKEFVKTVYSDNELSIILSKTLSLYAKYASTVGTSKNRSNEDATEEVQRVRDVYRAREEFTITMRSVDEWDLTIDMPDLQILATLSFVDLPKQVYSNIEVYPQLRVLQPRMKVSDNMSFGGLLCYRGFTPMTALLELPREEMFDNIYQALSECTIDTTLMLPYNDSEYKACLNRFYLSNAYNLDLDFSYMVELDTEYFSDQTKYSMTQRAAKLQSRGTKEGMNTSKAVADTVYISQEVFESKIGNKAAYLYLEVVTELGISGYYKAIPLKGLNTKSVLMNAAQLIDLSLRDVPSSERYVTITYNLAAKFPSRPLVVRRRDVTSSEEEEEVNNTILHYIQHNVKILASGHVYPHFEVLDSGNDRYSTLHIEEKRKVNLSIEILPPATLPVKDRRDPLSLSPSAYSPTE